MGTRTRAIYQSANEHNFNWQWSELGPALSRFSLATVFAWIGAMKFTDYEAQAISGLVESSPFTGWLYALFSIETAAALIGTVELISATLLALGYWFPKLGAVGAAVIAMTLIVTSSFLLTAPVVEGSLGFPALTVLPGQFLLKDIALLGLAIWLLSRDLSTARNH